MRPLAVLTLIALCSCEPISSDFRNEMRRKSAEFGLAIGYVGGSAMEIFPTAGGPLTNELLENYSGPCRICPGWFSSDGKLIVWQQIPLYQDATDPGLVVQTVTGETVSRWVGKVIDVYALALSPDKSKVAFEAWDHSARPQPDMGLQYVVLGTPRREILEAQPPKNEVDGSENIGWSPDSKSIVFSRHGKVVIIDIETAKREEIASGSMPAWSPDGRWISFASPDLRPVLIDPSNLKQVVLAGGRKITGPIAWSPDSCCISFSEKGKGIADVATLSGDRITVYRISDGEWFSLARFGLKGGMSSRFGWFYDYKALLARNESRKKLYE